MAFYCSTNPDVPTPSRPTLFRRSLICSIRCSAPKQISYQDGLMESAYMTDGRTIHEVVERNPILHKSYVVVVGT